MHSPQYIPSFYFYKFAQGISEPYTALDAYKGGAIDERGNVLKAESSIDPLEYLIIKLKKIFEELPSGLTKAKLSNYMSTMQLFGEEVQQIGITESEYIGLVEGYLAVHIDPSISYVELLGEDMGAGSMAVAGTSPDYNQGNVSGYDPVMGTTKRKSPATGFDACEMFDVCPEEMAHFKQAKAWKHVPDSETKRYLQRYQRRNPKAHLGLRSVDPATGKSQLHWVSLKPMSFVEEFGLQNLNILMETPLPAQQKTYELDNPEDVADVFGNMAGKLNPKMTSVRDHASNLEYATRLAAGIHGLFSANKFSKQNYRGQSSHEKDFLNALGNVSTKQSSTADASGDGISDVVMFGKTGKVHAVDTKHRYDAKSAKGVNIGAIPGLKGTLESYLKKASSAKSIPSKEFQQHHADIKDQIVADVESQKYPLGLGIYQRGAGMPEYEYGFHGSVIVTPKNRQHVTDWVKSRPMSPRSAFIETTASGNVRRFQPSVKELRSSSEMKKITGASGPVEEHPDRLFVTDNMLKHLESRMGEKGSHLMPIIHYHLARHGLYHPNPQHGDREFDLDPAD